MCWPVERRRNRDFFLTIIPVHPADPMPVPNLFPICLMERRGLLSHDQLKDVLARGKAQESRLFSHYHSGTSRRSHAGTELVSDLPDGTAWVVVARPA